jgi:hypothetical protein
MKLARSVFAVMTALFLLGAGCQRRLEPMELENPGGQQTKKAASTTAFRDRHEFAKLLSLINLGMPAAEVMRILGKPDDITTGNEIRGSINDSNEEWCFGTDGHLSFPTLGTVHLGDANGRKVVKWVDGGKGNPPPASLFTEEELRKILPTLDGGYGLGDPVWTIKAVNTLQPLGERKALAAIDEFIRVTHVFPYVMDMMLLFRVLYDVPKDPGYMPRFNYPSIPVDPKDSRVPGYPILILGDVPLFVAENAGFSSGPATDFAKESAFFRDHATFRSRPLRPTDKPLNLYSEWKTYDWLYRDLKEDEAYYFRRISEDVKWQLQRLVRTVFRGDVEHGTLPRPVRWDMKRNMYTFLDGTTLPETSSKEEQKSR